MPEIWHIWTNCWQKQQAALFWTVFEKLMQAQCLTVLSFITFCIQTNLLSDIVSLGLLTLRNQFAVKFLSFSSYTLTNLVHHIPLTNLRQVFFFLSSIMILKLLRKEKGYNKQLVGIMRLNVWSSKVALNLPMELEEPEPQQMQACCLYWCRIPLHRDLSHSHFDELSAKTLEKCQIFGVPFIFMLSLLFALTNNLSFADRYWG